MAFPELFANISKMYVETSICTLSVAKLRKCGRHKNFHINLWNKKNNILFPGRYGLIMWIHLTQRPLVLFFLPLTCLAKCSICDEWQQVLLGGDEMVTLVVVSSTRWRFMWLGQIQLPRHQAPTRGHPEDSIFHTTFIYSIHDERTLKEKS